MKSNVVNGKPYAVTSLREFRLLPGAAKSISRLKNLGFKIIVITNQPEVAKNKLTLTTLNQMNDILRKKTELDDIFICTHKKEDNCRCRKPKNGLLKINNKLFSYYSYNKTNDLSKQLFKTLNNIGLTVKIKE